MDNHENNETEVEVPGEEAETGPALAVAHSAEAGMEPAAEEPEFEPMPVADEAGQDEFAHQDESPPETPAPDDLAPDESAPDEFAPEEPAQPELIVEHSDAEIRAVLEAIIYVTDEPLSMEQMAAALGETRERITALLDELTAEFAKPEHGLAIQEIAGGFKMATKPEHHDAVRAFVKKLKPPLKLSLPALETLAVIAYKQPVTAPEIMEIRGVQGAGVLKTLLDRKLVAAAGRKNVIGKPILYKTTREFLVQFGLKDLNELPSLKEFEELRRMAVSEGDDMDHDADRKESSAAPESRASEPEAPVESDAPAREEQS